jgi:hypothetical protein
MWRHARTDHRLNGRCPCRASPKSGIVATADTRYPFRPSFPSSYSSIDTLLTSLIRDSLSYHVLSAIAWMKSLMSPCMLQRERWPWHTLYCTRFQLIEKTRQSDPCCYALMRVSPKTPPERAIVNHQTSEQETKQHPVQPIDVVKS